MPKDIEKVPSAPTHSEKELLLNVQEAAKNNDLTKADELIATLETQFPGSKKIAKVKELIQVMKEGQEAQKNQPSALNPKLSNGLVARLQEYDIQDARIKKFGNDTEAELALVKTRTEEEIKVQVFFACAYLRSQNVSEQEIQKLVRARTVIQEAEKRANKAIDKIQEEIVSEKEATNKRDTRAMGKIREFLRTKNLSDDEITNLKPEERIARAYELGLGDADPTMKSSEVVFRAMLKLELEEYGTPAAELQGYTTLKLQQLVEEARKNDPLVQEQVAQFNDPTYQEQKAKEYKQYRFRGLYFTYKKMLKQDKPLKEIAQFLAKFTDIPGKQKPEVTIEQFLKLAEEKFPEVVAEGKQIEENYQNYQRELAQLTREDLRLTLIDLGWPNEEINKREVPELADIIVARKVYIPEPTVSTTPSTPTAATETAERKALRDRAVLLNIDVVTLEGKDDAEIKDILDQKEKAFYALFKSHYESALAKKDASLIESIERNMEKQLPGRFQELAKEVVNELTATRKILMDRAVRLKYEPEMFDGESNEEVLKQLDAQEKKVISNLKNRYKKAVAEGNITSGENIKNEMETQFPGRSQELVTEFGVVTPKAPTLGEKLESLRNNPDAFKAELKEQKKEVEVEFQKLLAEVKAFTSTNVEDFRVLITKYDNVKSYRKWLWTGTVGTAPQELQYSEVLKKLADEQKNPPAKKVPEVVVPKVKKPEPVVTPVVPTVSKEQAQIDKLEAARKKKEQEDVLNAKPTPDSIFDTAPHVESEDDKKRREIAELEEKRIEAENKKVEDTLRKALEKEAAELHTDTKFGPSYIKVEPFDPKLNLWLFTFQVTEKNMGRFIVTGYVTKDLDGRPKLKLDAKSIKLIGTNKLNTLLKNIGVTNEKEQLARSLRQNITANINSIV